MIAGERLVFQPSLFGDREPEVDTAFATARRTDLDAVSWIEHAPGWVSASDTLFVQLLEHVDWDQRQRRMYDDVVDEPRLTARWRADSGTPLHPPVLERMRRALSERYGRELDSLGLNLYRDGRDSVAWHGDRIARSVEDPVVALVSVGEPRRFLLRPRGGGRSRALHLGRGDLLVTGGGCQRRFEHSVPKVARAGPRISLAFRHSR